MEKVDKVFKNAKHVKEKVSLFKYSINLIQMYQMGPGMYQQVQKHCDTCSGQGEIIA